MVKFVFEISKKTLPNASTFIRAVLVGVAGIRTVSLPSLGVLAVRVNGKLLPPSLESIILTFAQLIGAPAVFATFQVTSWFELPGQETGVLGAVTAKGPAVETTPTCIAALAVPPPAARLSRAVKRKFIVRVVEGITSPVRNAPVVGGGTLALLMMYCMRGNVRVVLAVGKNERKSGRVPSSLWGGAAAPRSNSSQTQVSASAFGSVTPAVSVKGVLAGS